MRIEFCKGNDNIKKETVLPEEVNGVTRAEIEKAKEDWKKKEEYLLYFVDIDFWSRPVYIDQFGNLWKDVNLGDRDTIALYNSSTNTLDGEPDCPIRREYTIVNPFKRNVQEGEYMLLGRLQRDCEYYLGYGNRSKKCLWAGSEEEQIAEMKKIYRSLNIKPDWISYDDILRYEKEMIFHEEENMETCSICKTVIEWEGRDDQNGRMWYCEECMDCFCEKCFTSKHDESQLYKMLQSEEEILCPTCYDKKRMKKLWYEFGDIPMDPETEEIEEPWNDFPVGTHRYDIWHWFEREFSISVTELLYNIEGL